MSLLRQLLVISSLVIVCAFVGILALGSNQLENSLTVQAQANAKTFIDNLSIVISAQPDAESRAKVLKLAYQQDKIYALNFIDNQGQEIFAQDRSDELSANQPWTGFIASVKPLKISKDIKNIGYLSVTINPIHENDVIKSYIYQWLWAIAIVLGLWLIFIGVLKSSLRKLFRQVMQSPEIRVKPQAEDLAEAELLDAMQERISPTVDEQMARIEQLELELNRDPVTGLANRTYFLNELKRVLRDDARQGAVSGYVLLVRQRDMARLQNQTEQNEIDEWLHLLGKRILETIEEFPAANALAARLNGSDFVILFPLGGGSEVMQPIQKLQSIFDSLRVKIDSHNLSRWALALTDYTENCSTKDVLTRLDFALMHAESAGHAEIEFISHADDDNSNVAMGEASWRTMITQALDHDQLKLEVQKIEYEDDPLVARYEASLLLYEDGSDQDPISGYLFMPPATRLGLSSDCDMRALCLALGWLGENAEGVLVIRMSVTSFMDKQYLEEIRKICEFADQSLLPRVVIELDAHGLVKNLDLFKEFAEGIIGLGMHIGLRGLDLEPDALRKIHEVNFAYVKLGGKFVRELKTSPGGLQMLVAVTETAIGMGMRVYVDDITDANTRQLVKEYGALPRK